jgi:hypothetical protein
MPGPELPIEQHWSGGKDSRIMVKTLRALRFLFVGPVILLILFVLNWTTSFGHGWLRWAVLGIGIAWIISLMRVLWALVLAGGIAALIALLRKRN